MKKYQKISEVKDFGHFERFIKFQDILVNATMETIDEDFNKILEIFKEEDSDELATNTLVLSFLQERKTTALIEIAYKLCLKWERFKAALLYSLGCRDITYPYTKLFRTLYYKGIYTLEDLQTEATFITGFNYMFAKEIDSPETYPEHMELMKDNWKSFDEVMEYGFEKNSIAYAITYDDVELLEKLSQQPNFSPTMKVAQSYYNTACKPLLYMAVFYNSRKCQKFLMDRGAEFDVECLGASISGGDDDLFHKYIDKFPNAGKILNNAVWRRRDEIFDELIERYPNEIVPVQACAHVVAYKYVYFFTENGADPSDPKYEPTLFQASKNGLLSVVQYLVEKGFDINVRTWQQETALHAAVRFSRKEVIKYLVEHGIDVNAYGTDDARETAYDIAESFGYNDIASYLKEHGGLSIQDIDAKSK